MANRPLGDPVASASLRTDWLLREVGRELRIARVSAGLRQRDVARRIRTSLPRVSRVENGRVRQVSIGYLQRHAAAVGLKPYIKLYPAVRRLLDEPQLSLLRAFRARLHPTWRFETEVPVPLEGDLRAADCRFTIPGCVCIGEAYTRLADAAAQSRAALIKKLDLQADRVVLIVKGSTTNRNALAAFGEAGRSSFPLHTRELMRALAEGRDPGADGIVVL